ncbi:MAG: VCBS repeat-containing protein [Planctomycetales bacterium]|nr:VCBS repeat-containing protein [Planctomycetales bacterium]
MRTRSLIPFGVAMAWLALVPHARAVEPDQAPRRQHWEIKSLTVDANEGIALADFNNDGLLDVVAGRNWYAAPAFLPRPVRAIDDWNGYAQSNGDFAYDVDRDGWMDVISGGFTTPEVYWFRNPGGEELARGYLWEKHLLFDFGCNANEGQILEDLDGDGVPEWIANSWVTPSPQYLWRFAASESAASAEDPATDAPMMQRIEISQTGNGHGMGVGDLNGDGRLDIVCGTGWYECPADELRYTQRWQFHADWPPTDFSLPVLIKDVDADGRNDIVWGTGHGFGLQWWRQLPPTGEGKTEWETHVIDDSFSQAHALAWADLDGDGQEDLITGKRVRAHNGGDPGAAMPPCIQYYSWSARDKAFKKSVINEGMVGIGLQIRTGDLNGDGRTDVAVAGKGGVFLLFNRD